MVIKDDGWEKLSRWMVGHPGFESKLEMRDVPGAGRGLFTTSSIELTMLKPGATMLHIPSSTMLNPLTLARSEADTIPSHLFPRSSHRISPSNHAKRVKTTVTNDHRRTLDTTQLLTLHLALSRDPKCRHRSDWQVYIDTLPTSFIPWHPLTWLVAAGSNAKGKQKAVEADQRWWAVLAEEGMSRAARDKLDDVKKRFDADLDSLMDVLRHEEPFYSQRLTEVLSIDDILWAWLNVNTRSVSIPLGLPSPTQRNNHTLVPMLDYINHSSNPFRITSEVYQLPSSSASGKAPTRGLRHPHRTGNDHLVPGRIDFRFSAPKEGVEGDTEVLFQYGAHSSAALFAEYGFVDTPIVDGEQKWLELQHGEVDVSYEVAELWKGIDQAEDKKQVLMALGCWGRNVLHAQPSPAHPSHSLLMTLRLLLISPADMSRLNSIRQGLVTYISASNEHAVMRALAKLCEGIVHASRFREAWLKQLSVTNQDKQDAVRLLSGLCEEERVLAEAVLKRIEAGDDLS